MLQNQRQALGTFGGTCETCKPTHVTKSKTVTWDFGVTCKTCKHIYATKSKTKKTSLQIRLQTISLQNRSGGLSSKSDDF